MIDPARVVVACATRVEARAAAREIRAARVIETGIALRSLRESLGECVVSCGLAGGLRSALPTGAVIVPDEIGLPDGTRRACDPELSEALVRSARELGIAALRDPVVTTPHIVRGADRERWAAMGYAAVDMETGLLEAPRLAAVRVVLDTPLRELSEEWLEPFRAMLRPRNWPEMFWLAREGPACARLAARVVAGALRRSEDLAPPKR